MNLRVLAKSSSDTRGNCASNFGKLAFGKTDNEDSVGVFIIH